MPLDVSITRVSQRGLPPGLAVAAFALVLGAIVGIGLFAHPEHERPAPSFAAVVPPSASSSASPTARPTRPPTPRPTEMPPCTVAPLPAVAAAPARVGRALKPTGIETVTTQPAAIMTLVRDRDGSLWGFGPGHLVRVDSPGAVRTWTYSDDEAFDAAGITSAAGGGVWLYGSSGLTLFDGATFTDVVTLPQGAADMSSAAEGPDGAVWVATSSGTLWRWDGQTWETVVDCVDRSGGINRLAIDSDGDVWVNRGMTYVGASGIARFDGTRWWHYTKDDTPSLGNQVFALEPATDGSMWVGSDAGVTRFDDVGFSESYSMEARGAVAIAPLEDGSAWVLTAATGGWGLTDLRIIRVGSAVRSDTETELSAPGVGYAWAAALRDTPAGLFLGTQTSFVRLVDDRWEPVIDVQGPPWIGRVIALSSSAALFTGGDTVVWQVSGSRSAALSGRASPMGVAALARDDRGRVWAATGDGARVYVDGTWHVDPGGSLALSVAVGRDGTAWFGMPGGDVERVAFDGSKVTSERLPPSGLGDVQSIAVGADGAVWAGWCACDGSNSTGLARFDGREWNEVRPIPGSDTIGTNDIAIAPDGDVWVVLADQPTGAAFVGRLHRGQWVIYDGADGLPEGVGSIAIGRDGTAWVGGSGIARFDGRRWSTRFAGHWFGSISVAPDGTVWAAGPSGLQRLIAGS